MSGITSKHIVKASRYSEAFWNEWLCNPEGTGYNCHYNSLLTGEMNLDVFGEAVDLYMQKNPIISSNFFSDESGELYQILNPVEKGILKYIDMSDENPDLVELCTKHREKLFNLKEGPLAYIELVKVDDNKYLFQASYHHIVYDGTRLFVVEFADIYNSLLAGINVSADNIKYEQLSDLNAKHDARLAKINRPKAMEYFSEKIKGKQLSIDFNNGGRTKDIFCDGHVITADNIDIQKIKDCIADSKTSSFSLLSAAFAMTLAKYYNLDSISFLYPMNMRDKSCANLDGCYVNVSLLVVDIQKETRIIDILTQISQQMRQGIRYRFLPWHEIYSHLAKNSNLSPNIKYFNVGVSQSIIKTDAEGLFLDGMQAENVKRVNMGSSDLTFESQMDDNGVRMCVSYQKEIFSFPFIEQFSEHLLVMLEKCTENINAKFSDISLLNENEYDEIINQWNNNEKEYLKETIHGLFEQQVLRTPEKTALVLDGESLTYQQLNEKANQLARLIGKQDPGTRIGVCVEPSLSMIIAILGVLKSGAAYVPFDISEPGERLYYKVNDCNCKLVVASDFTYGKLNDIQDLKVNILNLDESAEQLEEQSTSSLISGTAPDDLAYIIYTSGSTGMPKGVMLEHYGVSNLVTSHNQVFNLDNGDKRVLQFASLSFDASVSTIFAALFYGNTLYLCSDDKRKDINLLQEYIMKNDINFLDIPVKILESFDQASLEFPEDTNIIVAGETCGQNTMDLWGTKVNLFNAYGPTEATVCSSIHRFKLGDINTNIGKAIGNKKLYILDEELQPVPVGVSGELFISGDGLARGYFGKAELTAERFINNPFEPGTKMYRTGDVVRWLAEGDIEFIGRNDDQVKIRGFRVELGEIENKISLHPEVERAVVLCKKHSNGEQYIAAYYSAKVELEYNDLKNFLSDLLPDYMQPSIFVFIEEFSVNTSGKIDKKVLPEPVFENTTTYVKPETETEKEMCRVWEEILDVSQVGTEDDFFMLGGSSILVIKMVNAISKQLGIEVPVAMLFEHSTVKSILDNVDGLESVEIPKVDEECSALSFAQERLYFIDKLDGSSRTYNIPLYFKASKMFSIDTIVKSLRTIIGRHDILRTVYLCDDEGSAYQTLTGNSVEIEVADIAHDMLNKKLMDDFNTVFSLDQVPLKLTIYKVEDEVYISLIIHHISFDGWSVDVLQKELTEIATAYETGVEPQLTDSLISYRDFAVWQRKHLAGEVLDKQVDFWKQQLMGYENLSIPLDFPRPANLDYKGGTHLFNLGASQSKKLRQITKQNGTTVYNVLLGTFYVLLAKLSGQDDIVVGSPFANRNLSQLDNVMGFFINSLPVRVRLDEIKTFSQLVAYIDLTMKGIHANQDLPFEKLVDAIKIPKTENVSPIFQTMFSVQSFGSEGDRGFENITFPEIYDVAKFDISFFVDDSNDSIECWFNYASSLFKSSSIERFAKYFLNIIDVMVESFDFNINKVNMLDQAEEDRLVYSYNMTEKDYAKETIHGLFEQQVLRTPNNIAIVLDGEELTYKELDEKANQVANCIRKIYPTHCGGDITKETFIGLYMEPSLEMVVGLLGIMKAGAIYVPFDPLDANERLVYKVNDSCCKLILTSNANMEKVVFLTEYDMFLLNLNSYWPNIEKHSKVAPKIETKPDDLAYMIYTSGSTGNPKGVVLEHYGVNNLMASHNQVFGLDSGDKRVLQFASLSFDASISTIFVALFYGNTLYLCSGEKRKDINLLQEYIMKNEINFLDIPVKILESFDETRLTFPANTNVIVAGETCGQSTMDLWGEKVNLFNAYGPTEATVCSSIHRFKRGDINTNIGKAIDNKKLYILDEKLQPVPIGVSGELFIGGDGLARGYLNQPELTAERFIDNPFVAGTKMYKTGDVVRWLGEGDIEFVGRNDDQVKIHGFRIELGEIENKISLHPDIERATILCKKHGNGEKYIAAYYSAKTELEHNDLKDFLSNLLPDYMLPSIFVFVDEFTVNTSGKIDKKLLPEPVFKNTASYVKPETDAEKILCEIWQELFDMEKIGINSDFFQLGGNSILTIQLVSKLRKKDIIIAVKDVFSEKTIANLAALISDNDAEFISKSEQGILEDSFDLLPIQKWYFEKDWANLNYFNQSIMVKTPILELNKLQQAVDKLVVQHDILSALFSSSEQTYNVNTNISPIAFIDATNLTEEDLNNQLTALQSNFDIANGPTWNVAYIQSENDDCGRVYLAAHHILIDVVSWSIIKDDLQSFYEGADNYTKTDSYRQWVNAIKAYPASHAGEAEYWMGITKKQCDYAEFDTSNAYHATSSKLEYKLLLTSKGIYDCSEPELLYSALVMSLENVFSKTEHYVTMEKHGRENITSKTSIDSTVGWFTNLYPLSITSSESVCKTVRNTKNAIRNTPNNGIGYSAFKYFGDSEEISNSELPKVSLNYLGVMSTANKGDSKWQLCPGQFGEFMDEENILPDTISANVVVVDGQIRIDVATRISQETSDNLRDAFEHNLHKIEKEAIRNYENNMVASLSDESEGKDNMIFIHPGRSCCDIYEDLASKIVERYNCYGIKNYNLYKKEQISDIELLARKYVAAIEQSNLLDGDEINFAAHCVGGIMAIEMAMIIEQRFPKLKINLYLLSSISYTEELFNLIDDMEKEKDAKQDEVISSILVRELFTKKHSRTLPESVNVTLFKANRKIDEDSVGLAKTFVDKCIALEDNNLSAYASHAKVIKMDSFHETIIHENDKIVEVIMK